MSDQERTDESVPLRPVKRPRMNVTHDQFCRDVEKCREVRVVRDLKSVAVYEGFDTETYVRHIVLARMFGEEYWDDNSETEELGNREYDITPLFNPPNWKRLTGDDDNCEIGPEYAAEQLKLVVQTGLKVLKAENDLKKEGSRKLLSRTRDESEETDETEESEG